MNSFHFAGRLADGAELKQTAGGPVAKFRLIRNEYAGKDEKDDAKERIVAIPFVVFGARAEALSDHTRKGDQVIVRARIANNRYTSEGTEHFDYNFIVEEWEFGAPGSIKRAELDQQ